MSAPAGTVLMGVHNYERFVREAIDSILASTCRDFAGGALVPRSMLRPRREGRAGVIERRLPDVRESR